MTVDSREADERPVRTNKEMKLKPQNTRRRLALILLVGFAAVSVGVFLRVNRTVVPRWTASHMNDAELGRQAASKDATYPLVAEWASRLERNGNFAVAARTYERAALIDPVQREAWAGWGRTLFAMGDWSQAERVLRQTVTQWPQDGQTRFVLSGLLASSFRLKEARTHLKVGLESDTRTREPLLALGQLEMKLGNPKGAVEAFRKATTLGASLPALRRAYGVALLADGNVPAAVKELDAALKGDPSDLEARLQLGKALVRTGRAEDRVRGMKELSRVAEFSNNKAPAFVEAARVWIAENNLTDAGQALEHAVDANPNDLDAVRMLIEVYTKGNQRNQASRFVNRRDTLERIYSEREAMKKDIGEGRNIVSNLLRLGDLDMRLTNSVEARLAYNAALALEPRNAKAILGLAKLDKKVK